MIFKTLKYSFILIFSLVCLHTLADTVQLGDLAPRGATDGQLNAGDVVIMQRIINGDITASSDELLKGDVAPLGAPADGINAADLLILQRAVLGEITLGTVNIATTTPVLDAIISPTNTNPYPVSGTATPGNTVTVYVGGVQKGVAVADLATGVFSVPVVLAEGNNNIYAIADDGVDFSPQSITVIVNFQYIDGSTLSGALTTQTLNANTRYTVTSNISVAGGETLTVEAGAKIDFQAGAGLTATYNSALVVNGTALNPVVFTYDASTGTPVPGAWSGIKIGTGQRTVLPSIINYAVIEYAAIGIRYYWANNTNTLTNSIIQNNVIGIEVDDSSPLITNNQIINNEKGINLQSLSGFFSEPAPVINNNEIYGNSLWNIYTEPPPYAFQQPIVNARNNWWDTSDPVAIAASIYDLADAISMNLPTIDFGGFLDGAGGVTVGDVMPAIISVDTAYTGGVIYVTGNIVVTSGATLTINAGVEVRMMGPYSIKTAYDSALVVNGTALNRVVFTYDTSNSIPPPGAWPGIEIGTGQRTVLPSIINYAVIEYAAIGIRYYWANNTNTLSNSIIQNNVIGIEVNESSPLITNNQIINNEKGINLQSLSGFFSEPAPVINNNEIYGNSLWSIYTESSIYTPIVNARNNWWGTTDVLVIGATIYDQIDTSVPSSQPNNPLIDFGDYLDAAEGVVLPAEIMPVVVSVDTTYSSGVVYVIGNIEVKTGATLTINAGVEVRMMGPYSIKTAYDSALVVNGTALNRVVFTYDTSNSIPPPGAWPGIEIGTGQRTVLPSIINYAVIEYAAIGIRYYWANNTNALSNSIIQNNVIGIEVNESSPLITNNQIINNEKGINLQSLSGFFSEPAPVINNNEIYGNSLWNIYAESIVGSANPLVDARNNWWGTADPVAIATSIYDLIDTGLPNTSPNNALINFSKPYDLPNGTELDVYVGEVINIDTVFSEETYIYGDVSVSVDATLTINSGATIRFGSNSSLTINGSLVAIGTEIDPVAFIPAESTSSNTYWQGIKFNGPSPAQQINIDYCYISNAQTALDFENASGSISNCVIINNEYGIRLFENSNPAFTNNIITNNNFGILLDGSGVVDPLPSFIANDIHTNTQNNVYVLQYTDTSGLNFTNNWWDDTDITAIQQTILRSGSPEITLASIATTNNNSLVLSSYSVDNNFISPQTSIGLQDSVSVTATFSQSVTWSVEIYSSNNLLVYSQQPSIGVSVNATWDGNDLSSIPVADGRYTILTKNNGRVVNASIVTVDNSVPSADIDNALNGLDISVDSLDINGIAIDVNISSYTVDIADGFSPLSSDYRNLNLSTANVGGSSLYNWLIYDGGANQESAGDKTLKLTVTDKAGNISVDTVQITLKYVSIANVSYMPTSFNPALGETTGIKFTIGQPATVSLYIYRENTDYAGKVTTGTPLQTGTVPIRTITNIYTTIGEYTIPWDGKDDAGVIVSDEAYRFEMQAVDSLGNSGSYALPVPLYSNRFAPNGFSNVLVNRYSSNYAENNYLKYVTTINPGFIYRFQFSIASNSVSFVAASEVLEEGVHTTIWDVRNFDGKILDTTAYYSNLGQIFTLAPNSIVVKGGKPKLQGLLPAPDIEIKSDPYRVVHNYDQVSNIDFTVSQDSLVTVKILPPCMVTDTSCTIDPDSLTAITLKNSEMLIAEDAAGQLQTHSFEWRGYNFKDAQPDTNNILVDMEGVYTYYITATSQSTGQTSIYRGSLQLFR